ncbi:2-keto-4-pentenoate hydratase [Actinomycetes bacterium NPDC127524]
MSKILNSKVEELAESLLKAESSRQAIKPITVTEPSLSLDDAYEIQLKNIQEKQATGDFVSGKKIGLTSHAMQQLLGVDQPDYGHLLSSMEYKNGDSIPMIKLLQPKIEAEIAFVLKRDLKGPHVTSLDVLLATEHIVPAFEIVDSRIRDWKITIEDTVADNASSGLYVLGENYFEPHEIDLANMGMSLYRNGNLVNTGVGSAVLGHPATCVAWLANKLAGYGISLKTGEIILSGALSAAVEIKPGDEFMARFGHMGEVKVNFAM